MPKFEFAKTSPVRVFFTGRTRAGSWEIRGQQIASCRLNWEAEPFAPARRIDDFDIVCLVKKPDPEILRRARSQGKLIVYDIVDSWTQPDDGIACDNIDKIRSLFQAKWAAIQADAYIFPNATMYRDLSSLVPFSAPLYHHFRPGLEPIEIRSKVRRVGYEGNLSYLGPWAKMLQSECARRGWEFVQNPEDFSSIDIGFAARGGIHDSLLANRYKSNVKLANFYGAAMPCLVGHKEMSYQETDNGSVRFFADAEGLKRQLDSLSDVSTRKAIAESFRQARKAFHIERLADAFDQFFQALYQRHNA